MAAHWNENNLKPLSRINWRESLVPAAAVIPAPIAYIKVVAVKKLVVEFLGLPSVGLCPAFRGFIFALRGVFYCEKIRVFKAGSRLEYISME
jgi:hypothetical protein